MSQGFWTLVRLVRSRFPHRNEKKLSFFIVLEPPLESFSRSNNAWHFISRWKVHGFWASFWVSRFHRDSLCPHQIQGESLHMASSLRLQLPQETRSIQIAEEFGSWIFSRVWQSKKWENFSSYLCIFCYGGSYSHLVRPRLALMKHTWPFPKLPNGVGQPVNELRILPSELDFAATLSCSCFSGRKGSQTN